MITGATSGIGLARGDGHGGPWRSRAHGCSGPCQRGELAVVQVTPAGPAARRCSTSPTCPHPDAVAELGARALQRYEQVNALIHNAVVLSRGVQGDPGRGGAHCRHPSARPLCAYRRPGAGYVEKLAGDDRDGQLGWYVHPAFRPRGNGDEAGGIPEGAVAYARSKRAQVVLAAAWATRFQPAGGSSYSMHPGWADTPGLARVCPALRLTCGRWYRRSRRRHGRLARKLCACRLPAPGRWGCPEFLPGSFTTVVVAASTAFRSARR